VTYADLPQSGSIKQLGVKGTWSNAPIYYLNLDPIKVTDIVIKTMKPGGTWITSPSLNFASSTGSYDVSVHDPGQFMVSVACTPAATCYTGVWNPSHGAGFTDVDLTNGQFTVAIDYSILYTSGVGKQLGVIGGVDIFFLNLIPIVAVTNIRVQGSNDGGSRWFDVPIGFVAGTQSYPVAAARDIKVTVDTDCDNCTVDVWSTSGSCTNLPALLNSPSSSVSVKYASLPQSGSIKQLGVKGSWANAPIYYLNLESIKVTDIVIKTAGTGGTWITSPSLNFASSTASYDVAVPNPGQFMVSVACTPAATCYTGVWSTSGSYLTVLPVDLKTGVATAAITYADLPMSGTNK